MATETYQGWKNYETWAVALWLDNEESTYNYWLDAAQEAWDESETGGNRFVDERDRRAKILLADRLKRELDSEAELPKLPGFYADLLNAAIGEVDWYEIAEHYLETSAENA